MKNNDCRQDVIYLIRHLAKLLQADFDDRVSKVGLTGAQARILFFIVYKTTVENIEVHQNDIEREFALAKSTVNGLVSRLLKTKYITKSKSHPYAVLIPTEEGKNAVNAIKDGRVKTVNRLLDGYSEEEKQSVVTKLNKLVDNLEQGGKDNA